MGGVEHARYALGEHPFKKIRIPNIGVIVTAKSFKDGIQNEIIPKLQEVCGSSDIIDVKKAPNGIPDRIIWRTNSITYLMSAEQDDVAFESKTFDHVWIDEPVRRKIFVGLRRGLMKSGGHLWITATLLDEPWIFEELYQPGISGLNSDIEVFTGSTDENVHISEKNRNAFFSSLTEEEVETRRYGRPSELSGRVFKAYNSDIHRIVPFNIPYHWSVYKAIDPHPRKPHAVLYWAVSPDENHYLCNEIFAPGSAETLAGYIHNIDSQYQMVDNLIDTSAQEAGNWHRDSFREQLQNFGVRTRLAQKKNLVRYGIISINSLFEKNRLFVFNTLVRTHRELTLQVYKKSPDHHSLSEEPDKKYSDMTDCARYIASEKPSYGSRAIIQEPEWNLYARE